MQYLVYAIKAYMCLFVHDLFQNTKPQTHNYNGKKNDDDDDDNIHDIIV